MVDVTDDDILAMIQEDMELEDMASEDDEILRLMMEEEELMNPIATPAAPVEETGFLSNTLRGAGERAGELGGQLLQTGADFRDWMNSNLGEVVIGEEGIDYYSPEEIAAGKMEGKTISPLDIGAKAGKDLDLGYEADFTVDKLLDSENVWDGVKNTAGLIVEQGLVSAADMAALILNSPAYLAARTTELSYERAQNNNREEPTGEDRAIGSATALVSILIDKFALNKIQAKELADGFWKSLGLKGMYEGGTEAIQETGEYTGTTLGTEQGFKATEAGKAALGGGLGGVGVGVAFGVPSALATSTPVVDKDLAAADAANEKYLAGMDEELKVADDLAAEQVAEEVVDPVVPQQDVPVDQMVDDITPTTGVEQPITQDRLDELDKEEAANKAKKDEPVDWLTEAKQIAASDRKLIEEEAKAGLTIEQEMENAQQVAHLNSITNAVEAADEVVSEAEQEVVAAQLAKVKNPRDRQAVTDVGKAKSKLRKAKRKQTAAQDKAKVAEVKNKALKKKAEVASHIAKQKLLVGESVKLKGDKKTYEMGEPNPETGQVTINRVDEGKDADGNPTFTVIPDSEQEVDVTQLKRAPDAGRKRAKKLTKKEEANIADEELVATAFKPTDAEVLAEAETIEKAPAKKVAPEPEPEFTEETKTDLPAKKEALIKDLRSVDDKNIADTQAMAKEYDVNTTRTEEDGTVKDVDLDVLKTKLKTKIKKLAAEIKTKKVFKPTWTYDTKTGDIFEITATGDTVFHEPNDTDRKAFFETRGKKDPQEVDEADYGRTNVENAQTAYNRAINAAEPNPELVETTLAALEAAKRQEKADEAMAKTVEALEKAAASLNMAAEKLDNAGTVGQEEVDAGQIDEQAAIDEMEADAIEDEDVAADDKAQIIAEANAAQNQEKKFVTIAELQTMNEEEIDQIQDDVHPTLQISDEVNAQFEEALDAAGFAQTEFNNTARLTEMVDSGQLTERQAERLYGIAKKFGIDGEQTSYFLDNPQDLDKITDEYSAKYGITQTVQEIMDGVDITQDTVTPVADEAVAMKLMDMVRSGRLSPTQLQKMQAIATEFGTTSKEVEFFIDNPKRLDEVTDADINADGIQETVLGVMDKYAAESAADVEVKTYAPVNPDSPQFKAWFKDSKIVDENGDPLVVYHGSSKDFSQFEVNKEKAGGRQTTQLNIHFFTPSKDFANEYAEGEFVAIRPGGEYEFKDGVVYPVYLSVQKPFDMRQEEERVNQGYIDKYGRQMRKSEREAVKNGAWFAIDPLGPDFIAQLEAEGYDGILEVEDNVENIGVFKPKQIKSAISNTGEFKGDDIREAAKFRPLDNPSTVADIQQEFQEQFGTTFENSNVTILDSYDDLQPHQKESRSEGVVAFVTPTGKITLIADRIPKGEGVSLLMHEKGVHELLANTPEYKRVLDNIERILHDPNHKDYGKVSKARQTAMRAKSLTKNPANFKMDEETVAYLIQQNSTDAGFIKTVLRLLNKAFKRIMGDPNANMNVNSMVMLADGLIQANADAQIAAEQTAQNTEMEAEREAQRLADIFEQSMDESVVTSSNPDPDLVSDYHANTATQYTTQYDMVGKGLDNIKIGYDKLREKGLGFIPTRPLVEMLDRLLPDNAKVKDVFNYYDRAEAKADVRIEKLDEELIKPLQQIQHKKPEQYKQMVQLALRGSQLGKDITGTATFQALDQDVQDMYVSLLKHYRSMATDKLIALRQYTDSLDIDPNKKKQMKAQITELGKQLRANKGYVPFNRFGNYKVEGTLPDGERYVSQHDTFNDAKKARNFMQGRHGGQFDIGKVQSYAGAAQDLLSAEAYDRALKFVEDAGGNKEAKEALWQTFLEYSPQSALRKKVASRKSVMGMSADMVRGIGQSVHRDIRFNERLKVKGEVDKIFSKANEAIRKMTGDTVEVENLYSELRGREVVDLRANWSKTVTKANFGYYLGFNPASALVNLTQNAIVAMPVLSADYPALRVFREMNKSFAHVTRNLANKKDYFGYEGLNRLAMKRMLEDGTVNVTQAHMMTGINEGHTANYNPDGLGGTFTNAMAFMFHNAEIANRATTAMTAFKLKHEETGNFEESLAYAKDKTYESQFDFSETGKSRFQRGDVGNVLLAMKSYPISMAVYMAQNFNRWLTDSTATTEEKRAAKIKFLGTMANTLAIGGVTALPLSTLLPEFFNALFGDEEDDPVYMLRQGFEGIDPSTDNVLTDIMFDGFFGTVTGLDLESKVSLGLDMAARLDANDTNKQMMDKIIEGALGPVGGMVNNVVRGFDQIEEGKLATGLTTMLPAALRNFVKGSIQMDSGMSLTSKDTKIEDASGKDALLKMMGFNSTEHAAYFRQAGANYRRDDFARRNRSMILNENAWAIYNGSAEERREARKKIIAWNRNRPKDEQITQSTIKRAIKALRKKLSGDRSEWKV